MEVPLRKGGAVLLSEAGGRGTPASSRKVGVKSMTVEKERLNDPGGCDGWKALIGGLMTQGTRMPP